jgi:hypothetical protein
LLLLFPFFKEISKHWLQFIPILHASFQTVVEKKKYVDLEFRNQWFELMKGSIIYWKTLIHTCFLIDFYKAENLANADIKSDRTQWTSMFKSSFHFIPFVDPISLKIATDAFGKVLIPCYLNETPIQAL